MEWWIGKFQGTELDNENRDKNVSVTSHVAEIWNENLPV
jgi:hypothetical protein